MADLRVDPVLDQFGVVGGFRERGGVFLPSAVTPATARAAATTRTSTPENLGGQLFPSCESWVDFHPFPARVTVPKSRPKMA